jgi:hypothetical protein
MPITVETFNNILNAQGWAAAEEALMAAGGTFGEPEAQAFEGFVEDDLMFGQLPGQTNPNYIPQGAITASRLGVQGAQPRQFDYSTNESQNTAFQKQGLPSQSIGAGASGFIQDVKALLPDVVPSSTPAPVISAAPAPATVTSTPTPAPAAAPTQAEQWATQYGQPGSPRVITELNKLSDSELQNLANNPEFLSLYPQAANILTTRNTTATAAAALSAQHTTWSNTYGAAGSQKAMDFIAMMDADEFSNMTQDFKDYYAAEYAARVIRDKGVGTVSASDTLIRLINDGGVVKASQLDAITDPTVRADAATRLANNIITKHGSTQEGLNLLTGIYMAYFDRPGGTGFSPWAESVGFGFNAQGNVIGSDKILSDHVSELELEGIGIPGEKTIPDYVPTGANLGAGPMATDATFTVADIAQDLASGILTTEDAIKVYRSLNTAEGNSRATALETGGVDRGTGLPIGAVGDPGQGAVQPGLAGTAQDRLNRIFEQSRTRGGRRDLFDAFSATQGGTPLQRSARNLSFDPLSASFAISQASDPSFNTLTDPEGVIRANPNSFRDFLASGEGGGMPQRLGTSAMSDAFKEFGSLYGNNNLSALDEARRDFISNAGQNLATEYLSSQVNPMFRSNIAGAVGRRFNASRDTDPLGDPFGGFLGRYGF